MSVPPLLSVKDLSIAFTQAGRTTLAVDRISFDIKPRETVALVGESGSGKSVTAMSVMKLLPYPAASHPSGTIHFKGKELLAMPESRMRSIRSTPSSARSAKYSSFMSACAATRRRTESSTCSPRSASPTRPVG